MVGYYRKVCSVFGLFIGETSVGILYPIIGQICKSLVLNISDFLKSHWYIFIMNCFQLNILMEYYVFSIVLQSNKEVSHAFNQQGHGKVNIDKLTNNINNGDNRCDDIAYR